MGHRRAARLSGKVRRLLPITPVHVYALADLPEAHKDRFDRLLVAQCRVGGMPLVSAGEVFRRYPIAGLA